MPTIDVTSDADLLALAARVWTSHARRSIRVSLHLAGVSAADRAAHERSLNRSIAACGCAEGAMSALVLAAIVLAHFALDPDWSFAAAVSLPIRIVGALAIGGAAGKLAGLALARLRFRWRCRRIFHDLHRTTTRELERCQAQRT